MSKPPPGIARFDSAAAMAQALASALRGEPFASPSQSPLLDRLMPAINALPKRQREWTYIVGGMSEGIGPGDAGRLDIERIAEWITGLYPRGSAGCAFVGSSNGAMIHLAAALGAPWLPQTFLCPVRAPFSDPDDVEHSFKAGGRIVEAMLAADSRIAVHQMHDPNQDRLMLHSIRYFRIKHRRLPLAYREFLLGTLERGATLYVVNCTRDWPVTSTGDRSYFQFGATGGATESEYLQGGERVRAFLEREGSARMRWEPPPPDTRAPEAEWGFDAALYEELERLAAGMDWRIVEIRFREPEALSFAAARVYRRWYEDADIEPRHLLVDSFMLMDPLTTLKLQALPFWLLFNVEPSADALQRFLEDEPAFETIDMMLFSHGVQSIGLAPISRWRALLDYAAGTGRFAGVDPERYPRDFATFSRFGQALAQLGSHMDSQTGPQWGPHLPPQTPLPALDQDRFETWLARYGESVGVQCAERAMRHLGHNHDHV
ncbi:hypothetical protein [Paraburkholderia sacchari]|uniref:Uncharacterized protein n=1 Tax=Paraburkholderia sacchari TaxID=159450 RepID=A0A8T6Z6S8_9BURK|nr:hypothetical protein [Paraburkholderia sacchari]NLP60293.1 hypothetical protein [Paraburkholderia sacchari]